MTPFHRRRNHRPNCGCLRCKSKLRRFLKTQPFYRKLPYYFNNFKKMIKSYSATNRILTSTTQIMNTIQYYTSDISVRIGDSISPTKYLQNCTENIVNMKNGLYEWCCQFRHLQEEQRLIICIFRENGTFSMNRFVTCFENGHVEVKLSRNFYTVIYYTENNGRAWSSLSPLFINYQNPGPVPERNVVYIIQLQNIIKAFISLMSKFDMYIFKKIIRTYSKTLSDIDFRLKSRKQLLLELFRDIRKTSKQSCIIEVFKQWYFSQPVIFEACQCTGGITTEIDRILTNTNALYKYLAELKEQQSLRMEPEIITNNDNNNNN